MSSLNVELTEEEYEFLRSKARTYDVLNRRSCFWCKGTMVVDETLRSLHKNLLANNQCSCKYGLCTCTYCSFEEKIHETDESH